LEKPFGMVLTVCHEFSGQAVTQALDSVAAPMKVGDNGVLPQPAATTKSPGYGQLAAVRSSRVDTLSNVGLVLGGTWVVLQVEEHG
jgi:hypothetical protein